MYFSPGHRVTVCVLVFQDGAVLLVRHNFRERHWSLPAGSLDRGESLAAAAQREVLEESGLVIEVGAALDVVEVPDKSQLIVPFLGTVVGGTLQRTTAETSDARFVPVDELPTDMRALHREIVLEAAARGTSPSPAPSARPRPA